MNFLFCSYVYIKIKKLGFVSFFFFFFCERRDVKLLKHLINPLNVSINMEIWIKAFFFFPYSVKNINVSNIYLQLFTNFRICISLF